MLIGIIADDLSGAGGIAGDFARFGMRACVVDAVDAERATDLEDVDVLVAHTNSRAREPKASASMNRRAALSLARRQPFLVVKKIDSLLRGPIASDVAAVMDALHERRVVVVAAVPGEGRTTIDGVQWADGAPLVATATDGTQKILRLPDVFAGADLRVHHLGTALVQSGAAAIEQAVKDAGDAIFVCDATTEEDINGILHGALRAGIRLVASSYGIAHSMLSACAEKRTGPVLAVTGSVSQKARQQLTYAVASQKFAAVFWDPQSDGVVRPHDACRSRVCELLRAGRSVLLHTASEADPGARQADESIGRVIESFLRALAQELPEAVSAFVATGGATAEALRSALGAHRLTMLGPEVLACVPLAVLEGGRFSRAPFITKPGSFGDERSLLTMMEHARIAALSARRDCAA